MGVGWVGGRGGVRGCLRCACISQPTFLEPTFFSPASPNPHPFHAHSPLSFPPPPLSFPRSVGGHKCSIEFPGAHCTGAVHEKHHAYCVFQVLQAPHISGTVLCRCVLCCVVLCCVVLCCVVCGGGGSECCVSCMATCIACIPNMHTLTNTPNTLKNTPKTHHNPTQELSFFNRLNLGELMARTSGDSLTLRTLVSNTLYQVCSGVYILVCFCVYS